MPATLSPALPPARVRAARRARLRPAVPASAMAFRRALPWLLASLALTVVTLVGQVPLWTILIFGACTVWRFLIERRGWALPSMLVRALLFFPVGFLVMRTYGTHPSATGLLTLLIALISLKTLELRSARDFTVAALLGYFMVLSAFFYSQSFALCLYLGVLIVTNSVALILCHGGGQGRSWPAVRLALGMGLQALPLVALLFIVFPRVRVDWFRRLGNGTAGRTGMSDRLTPGAFSSLAQSTETAFRAKITATEQTLTQNELYWRGLALDVCSQTMSWRASEQMATLPPRAKDQPFAGRVNQQITLFPQGERWLYALDRPAAVLASPGLHAELYATETLRNRDPVTTSKVTYSVVSELRPALPPELSPLRRKFYTSIPTDLSPRALGLARSWRGRSGTDQDVIRSAAQFFRTGGFAYSLTPGLLPKEGALDAFLFQSRQGFCEHYAAAFSVLMRAAGIPARVVVGYQGGEYNRLDGRYTVHQSDAHAWSEVWITGYGWLREDPTGFVAPDRVSYGAENYAAYGGDAALSDQARLDRLNGPGGWRWLVHNGQMAWDAADEQWNLLVLAYDQESQSNVLDRLGVGNLSWLGGIALTLAVAFSLLGLGTLGMRMLDRSRPSAGDPARRLYERFCRRAARHAKLPRAPSEGPLDFARRASEAFPVQAEQIGRITALYVASRYAPPGTDGLGNGLKDLREAIRALRLPRSRA